MEKSYLSATDMMKYLYCPRIIYYIYVLKSPQFVTRKENKGIEKYEDFKHKSKRNKIIKEFPKLRKLYDITLISKKYDIITKTDCIIFNDKLREAYPIQIKYSLKPKVIYNTQRYQLLLEAFLIEETFGYKVHFGFIKFLLSDEIVKINICDKDKVIDSFHQISKIITSESFPNATPYKKRCIDCCYKMKC